MVDVAGKQERGAPAAGEDNPSMAEDAKQDKSEQPQQGDFAKSSEKGAPCRYSRFETDMM